MKIELDTEKLLGFRLYAGTNGDRIGGDKVGGKDGGKDGQLLAGKMGDKGEARVGVKDGGRPA